MKPSETAAARSVPLAEPTAAGTVPLHRARVSGGTVALLAVIFVATLGAVVLFLASPPTRGPAQLVATAMATVPEAPPVLPPAPPAVTSTAAALPAMTAAPAQDSPRLKPTVVPVSRGSAAVPPPSWEGSRHGWAVVCESGAMT